MHHYKGSSEKHEEINQVLNNFLQLILDDFRMYFHDVLAISRDLVACFFIFCLVYLVQSSTTPAEPCVALLMQQQILARAKLITSIASLGDDKVL